MAGLQAVGAQDIGPSLFLDEFMASGSSLSFEKQAGLRSFGVAALNSTGTIPNA